MRRKAKLPVRMQRQNTTTHASMHRCRCAFAAGARLRFWDQFPACFSCTDASSDVQLGVLSDFQETIDFLLLSVRLRRPLFRNFAFRGGCRRRFLCRLILLRPGSRVANEMRQTHALGVATIHLRLLVSKLFQKLERGVVGKEEGQDATDVSRGRAWVVRLLNQQHRQALLLGNVSVPLDARRIWRRVPENRIFSEVHRPGDGFEHLHDLFSAPYFGGSLLNVADPLFREELDLRVVGRLVVPPSVFACVSCVAALPAFFATRACRL